MRARLVFVAVLIAFFACANSAGALDKVRLGKAVPNSFAFGAANIGIEAKLFEREGIDLETVSFPGDAKLQQGLAAGSLDVGLGSGPAMGFRAKGAPSIAVAAMFGPPSNIALLVPADSPVKTVADMKGKRVGVTTVGSLTDWLVRELSRKEGWGNDGMKILALGSVDARIAAMKTGQLDATVQEAATGYELAEQGRTRTLLLFGDLVKDFYTHVIFASDDMVEKRPELLRRFLKGWFETIAFMKTHRDFVIQSESKTISVRPSVAAQVYDAQINSFSTDGAWDAKSIDVIRGSLKELGILDFVPDAKKIYNDQFVPVKF